jgi:hypothetical protein
MMRNRFTHPEDLLPLGRVHAIALALFGPPDTPGHPFTGTRYDPRLKQHADQARRQARQATRARRRRLFTGAMPS